MQRQRESQYRERWQQQQRFFEQRERQLQQQRRIERWRFEQRYWERQRQDRIRLQNFRYYDYGYPNYRYYREGRYFETNQYGADLLRRALNNGYEEGFRAGQADRADGWGFSYQDSFAYQDSTFGYSGYYVGLGEYQYYFREGFRRGYEDGYSGRWQYGSYSSGVFSLLSGVLQGILDLRSF